MSNVNCQKHAKVHSTEMSSCNIQHVFAKFIIILQMYLKNKQKLLLENININVKSLVLKQI